MFGHFGNRHVPGEVTCHPVHFDLIEELRREVDEHLSQPTALAWTAHTSGERLIEALHRVVTAGDWPSFRRALEGWTVPSVNFTYADVDGNIGYQGTGLGPVRPPGDRGLVPTAAAMVSRPMRWRAFSRMYSSARRT